MKVYATPFLFVQHHTRTTHRLASPVDQSFVQLFQTLLSPNLEKKKKGKKENSQIRVETLRFLLHTILAFFNYPRFVHARMGGGGEILLYFPMNLDQASDEGFEKNFPTRQVVVKFSLRVIVVVERLNKVRTREAAGVGGWLL